VQTLKDRNKTIRASLPYVLQPDLEGELNQYCIDCINIVPSPITSDNVPYTLFMGEKPDYTSTFGIPFGRVAQFNVIAPTTANPNKQAMLGITLGPKSITPNSIKGYIPAVLGASGDVITGGGASSSGGGLLGSFMQAVNALHPNSKALRSDTPVLDARKQFPKLYDQYKKAGLALAKGGIVTRPVQALLGENGAEAVIPLNRSGVMGNTEINITVNAGMGTDGRAVGDDIVRALKQYERLNGYLPLTAQAVV
jgi:hypothetical protein